ncbi:S41 family peptidase [Pseudaestuariivita rosea]|uniref:S41 family peptidase n=1 Tax=Pseudaestuariivita rosea TaxID=2763263 RepID=UPI001ABAF1AB|nr:S41 family peptidase [Pseudaestuariivita rosea]
MRRSTKAAACTAAALSLLACASTAADIATRLQLQQSVWISDGYGYVIDLRPGQQRLYHVAGKSCVLDQAASAELDSILTSDSVQVGVSGSSFTYGIKYEPHRTTYISQDALPAACAAPLQNTVEGNFQAFADIFAANYAFFDLYGVNWDARVRAARQRLSADMTDEALFALFARMIAPLQDGHLELNAEIDGAEYSAAPKTTPLGRGVSKLAETLGVDEDEVFVAQLENYWVDGIGERILQDQGATAAGGKIQYGVIDGNIGYLAVLMLTGLTEDELLSTPDDFDADREYAAINQIMDDVMTAFADANVQAVIVDASINFGGNDFLGREIAARFADERRLVLTKRAADAQGAQATPVYVQPSDRPSFYGPVYLMTTESTVSAGEIMTLAFRAQPNVTHVGQPTQGALSDVLYKTLPNGWEIGMSNEVYRDQNGILWEGRGIPPELPINIFSETNLVSRHPAAVRGLVAHIQRAQSN